MQTMVVNWEAVQAIATTGGTLLTGGALVVTFLLLRAEVQARKQHDEALERERLEREEAQARLVSAWVTGPHGTADHNRIVIKLHMKNLSIEPVVGVVAHGLYEAVRDEEGNFPAREEVIGAFDIFPAQETWDLECHVPRVSDLPRDDDAPAVRLEFMDTHGRKWTRWPNGRLERLGHDT